MKLIRLLALVGIPLIGVSLLIFDSSFGDKPPIGWKRIDAGTFSLFAPPGWKFHELQGVDSYVGEFVGNGMALDFDFGQWSNSLDEAPDSYLMTYDIIDGLKAKIVMPRVPRHGITGIYFAKADLGNSFCLDAIDLDEAQQKLASRIFQTIRFKHSTRSIRDSSLQRVKFHSCEPFALSERRCGAFGRTAVMS